GRSGARGALGRCGWDVPARDRTTRFARGFGRGLACSAVRGKPSGDEGAGHATEFCHEPVSGGRIRAGSPQVGVYGAVEMPRWIVPIRGRAAWPHSGIGRPAAPPLEARSAKYRAIAPRHERHHRRSTTSTADDRGVRLPKLSESWGGAARAAVGLPLLARLSARGTAAGWVTATLAREALPLVLGEGEPGTAIPAGQRRVTSR